MYFTGCEKGQVILQSALYSCGEYAWKKDTAALHILLDYFCKQLAKYQVKINDTET